MSHIQIGLILEVELVRTRSQERVQESLHGLASGWSPEDRRARGKPKTTWRRIVEKERIKVGRATWNVAKAVAHNRKGWVDNVTDLCSFWCRES